MPLIFQTPEHLRKKKSPNNRGKEEKMKNFFFPDVSPGKKQRLQEAQVAFCDLEIDGSSGIVLDEPELTKALEVLGASVASEGATSYEGIFKIILWSETPSSAVAVQPKVSVGKWYSADGKSPDEFVRVVEDILLPVVGRDIVMTNADREPRVPVPDDGKFHLFVGYGQRTGKNTPNTIFGVKTGAYTELAPEGDGSVITEPQEGRMAVLQYKGNAAWVLVNIAHHGGQGYEHIVFRHILEEFVAEISLSPEEREKRKKRLAEARRKASREAYVKECSARFEKTVASTVQAISDGKNEIVRLQQALVRKIREVQGAERKLEQLSACKGGELEKYGQEFDKLLALPKVRDMQVADGVVKVFTDTLYCTDPRSGKRHEIGAFRIEINTSGANDGVRWFNLTRRVDGYERGMQAPHVFPQGRACLGNTAEVFPELIANYEFAAAAMVAIQFVESVNVDDSAGKYINRWPEVPAEEVKNV
jgi:hypothetical protein